MTAAGRSGVNPVAPEPLVRFENGGAVRVIVRQQRDDDVGILGQPAGSRRDERAAPPGRVVRAQAHPDNVSPGPQGRDPAAIEPAALLDQDPLTGGVSRPGRLPPTAEISRLATDRSVGAASTQPYGSSRCSIGPLPRLTIACSRVNPASPARSASSPSSRLAQAGALVAVEDRERQLGHARARGDVPGLGGQVPGIVRGSGDDTHRPGRLDPGQASQQRWRAGAVEPAPDRLRRQFREQRGDRWDVIRAGRAQHHRPPVLELVFRCPRHVRTVRPAAPRA